MGDIMQMIMVDEEITYCDIVSVILELEFESGKQHTPCSRYPRPGPCQ